MRLFLDAHVSGRSVGDRLAADGHDVRALDREPELEGLDDVGLLELAAADERVVVTFNVSDFPSILREWGLSGRRHAGVILVHGIDHSEFGLVIRGVAHWLAAYRRQPDWVNRAVVVSRELGSS